MLHDCTSCGGQFVEHALLEDLLRERELYGAAPRRPPRQNPLEAAVRYVACPVCNDIMNRNNFGRSSGVIVDVCKKHGVWFDRGELPRVLAFVEGGGLDLLRRREAEESAAKARSARVSEVERSLEALRVPSQFDSRYRSGETAMASLSLLGIIADLLD